MKLTSTVISLAALFSLAPADSAANVTAYYNAKYDNGQSSIDTVTCYNDKPVIYQTLGSLPNFPNIGSYQNAGCGSCWAVAYDTRKTVYILIVDGSNKGFQLSLSTLKDLGQLNGIQNKNYSLDVTATEVDQSKCGL